MAQLSHDYWKHYSLPIQTFVGKMTAQLFNTLSRFVIAFLPRNSSRNLENKRLLLVYGTGMTPFSAEVSYGRLRTRHLLVFSHLWGHLVCSAHASPDRPQLLPSTGVSVKKSLFPCISSVSCSDSLRPHGL